MRRMIGSLVLVGMRGNFEGIARNRVIDGCSRRGRRRLCKEDVGWIVDLNNAVIFNHKQQIKYVILLIKQFTEVRTMVQTYCDIYLMC